MSLLNDYRRCSKRKPCPICGRPDWCLIARDGMTAICPRTVSDRFVGDEAGYLHVIGDAPLPKSLQHHDKPKVIDFTHWEQLHRQCVRDLPASALNLADQLGIDIVWLQAVGLGWHEKQQCWTFPMYDGKARITGLRTRDKSGNKKAVFGSTSGVFFERRLSEPPRELLIVEGPTDVAAAYQIGMRAIGRPSCLGGTGQLLPLLANYTGDVVIIADNDSAGQNGAVKLAKKLAPTNVVKVITLPAKDLRKWVNDGGSADAIRAIAGSRSMWKEAA